MNATKLVTLAKRCTPEHCVSALHFILNDIDPQDKELSARSYVYASGVNKWDFQTDRVVREEISNMCSVPQRVYCTP